jgi:putative flippase GtrA
MNLPQPIASLGERLGAAWRDRALALKAMSFAVVGLINTIFFLMLAYVTPSLAIANITSWFIANVGSYVMNAVTTFSAETGGRLSLRHYAAFAGSGVVAVTASTITVVLAAKFVPVWAAKAIAILVSFAVNFSITHFVVFRTKSEGADARNGA